MTFTLTDTISWLAYADYLQDNDLPYQQIIDDLNDPYIDNWHFEHANVGVGSGRYSKIGTIYGSTVGVNYTYTGNNNVGTQNSNKVGEAFL